MGYQDLIRKSWRSGDFSIKETPRDGAETEAASKSRRRERACREMEEIVKRDAADANCCLNAHREGIMKLAPFVKFREEKFGAVLFETRSEKVYTLSPTGAAVVREVVAGVAAEGLIDSLKQKYDDPSGKMAQEAQTFLGQLKEKGLVTE